MFLLVQSRVIPPAIKSLCDEVRQIAFEIHLFHGHGHREKIYQSALTHRLRRAGRKVEQEVPVKVFDEDGTLLGEGVADLLVDEVLLVEVKASRSTVGEHEAQILGYLKAFRIEHGLLVNFGSYRFDIRKYAWTHSKRLEPETSKFGLLWSSLRPCGKKGSASRLSPAHPPRRASFQPPSLSSLRLCGKSWPDLSP